MDRETEKEIVRLYSKPHHRPFAEIDARLGLNKGDSWKYLEKIGLFERATFRFSEKKPKLELVKA